MVYEDLFVVQQRWVFPTLLYWAQCRLSGLLHWTQLPTNQRWDTFRLPASKLLPTSDEWFRVACLSNTSRQIHLDSCKILPKDHRQKKKQQTPSTSNLFAAGKMWHSWRMDEMFLSAKNYAAFFWQNQPFISIWLASLYRPSSYHVREGCWQWSVKSSLNVGAVRKCLHQPRNNLAK